jgi:sortase A
MQHPYFKRTKVLTYSIAFSVIATSTAMATYPSKDTHKSSEVSSSTVPLEMPVTQGVWIPELPVRLVIPTIGVDAEIQYVGLAEDSTGEMAAPSNITDVGWYAGGVRPGMDGSAVIAGHYNGTHAPKGVFYDLHTLQPGDEVVVMSADRIEDIFYVVKVETYNYDDPTTEVFISADTKSRLNLITCGGKWLSDEKSYDKRTVVFTELLTDVE